VSDQAVTSERRAHVAGAALLAVIALGVAIVAVLLHRNGHTQGDDFALYLRQARSVFDGDIGAVLADNRFAVLNSDRGFSPLSYPWGWPLLLSPFVHLWGFDYDRLKLVEVGVFVAWLVVVHGIVRRRIGRRPALAIVAVIGTAPVYLVHTDQLLTEFPHLLAVAVWIWWYDRVRSRSTLLDATTADLVTLGALVTLTYNVRREGIVLVGVIAVMQLYDLVTTAERRRSVRAIADRVTATWRTLATPYLSFAICTAAFQLLLPSELLPDNGNSSRYLDNRVAEYPGILTNQLGLGDHPVVGIGIIAVAAAGAVIGVRRRPTLDLPLLVLVLGTTLLIGTHFRQVDRYWFQITPLVLYFVTVALVAAHLIVLPGKIADARDYDAAAAPARRRRGRR